MYEFYYRTEDIKMEDIPTLYVENEQDRNIIDALKSNQQVILEGSRGVGKSFLFKVAESELLQKFTQDRILPVYISFNKSSLIHTRNEFQFQYWMMAKICSRITRELRKNGFINSLPSSYTLLSGDPKYTNATEKTSIEKIVEEFEQSWSKEDTEIDINSIPSIDNFKDAIEDICSELRIRKIILFIDEAAHIFSPEQQRQFFTLFRDLRNPYLACKAAVYPGVTYFGDVFQKVHDATLLSIDRDILSKEYLSKMKEIVLKQIDDPILIKNISTYAQNFNLLAYASCGNPRILLKTVDRASKMNSSQINELFRSYYRTEIWSEHTELSEKYPGHRSLIDWGRQFIEENVLPEIKSKNDNYLSSDKETSVFFWVNRDAPQMVKESLRLLTYTGIIKENSLGIKATRSQIGTRYLVNLGCLFSLESNPVDAYKIVAKVTPKRMTEYGNTHPLYEKLLTHESEYIEPNLNEVLKKQLAKDIQVLDLTSWQKQQLRELKLNTIGDVLSATETTLKKQLYVGDVRARRMRNAALTSVYEYLSG